MPRQPSSRIGMPNETITADPGLVGTIRVSGSATREPNVWLRPCPFHSRRTRRHQSAPDIQSWRREPAPVEDPTMARVTAVFDDRTQAERAIAELRRRGITDTDMSIVARRTDDVEVTKGAEVDDTTGERMGKGALAG